MKWQPIETAPRNGTPLLLALREPLSGNRSSNYVPWGELPVIMAWWHDDFGDGGYWEVPITEDGVADTEGHYSTFWLELPEDAATHWMPLPEPPE